MAGEFCGNNPSATEQALIADEMLYDHNLLDSDTEVWQLAELWIGHRKKHSAKSSTPASPPESGTEHDAARPTATPIENTEQVELNRLLLDAAIRATPSHVSIPAG
jgi:hypothetical protein